MAVWGVGAVPSRRSWHESAARLSAGETELGISREAGMSSRLYKDSCQLRVACTFISQLKRFSQRWLSSLPNHCWYSCYDFAALASACSMSFVCMTLISGIMTDSISSAGWP